MPKNDSQLGSSSSGVGRRPLWPFLDFSMSLHTPLEVFFLGERFESSSEKVSRSESPEDSSVLARVSAREAFIAAAININRKEMNYKKCKTIKNIQ